MNTPNIFRYARSSTLNIAMVGWILDHVKCRSKLRELGIDLLKLMSNGEIEEVETIRVLNMYKNIALVVEVDNKYVIAIEDITFSKNQCNILKKHREIILKDESYKNSKKIFVYIHIGNKVKCEADAEEGVSIQIRRNEILALIEKYRDRDEELLEDYIKYLRLIGNTTEAFKEKSEFKYWHRLTWEGYFNNLKKDDDTLDWDYSSSQNGDLISFAFNKQNKRYVTTLENELDYSFYLQIETELPCKYNYDEHKYRPYILFKVEVNDNKYKSEIRNYVWNKLETIKDTYENRGLLIEKTSHAIGKYMTIGKISNFETRENLEESLKIASELIKQLNEIC